MSRLLIIITFSIIICLPISGSSQSFSPANTNVLDETIEKVIEELKIPGIAIAISQNGKTLYSKGYGYSVVEENIKANSSTIFRMASVSKLFAAAAIAKLMEEGKIDINLPIEKYLPDYPHAGRGVTTKRLLSHQAGIRHYKNKDFYNGFRNFDTTEDALGIFIDDQLEYEPGSSYKYSSFAFTLIQAVVESVSGKEYLTYLKENIFAPLDMNHSSADRKGVSIENKSQLYRLSKKGKNKKSNYDNPSYKWAGGGMISNVEDLIKFGNAHLGEGFFNESTLDSIFTSAVSMPGTLTPTDVGLAWRISKDLQGNTMYHHAGNMNGARSFLSIFPKEKITIAIMTNNRQLDFIDHLALSIKEAVNEQNEEKIVKESYVILDTLGSDQVGELRLSGGGNYFKVDLNLKSIFKSAQKLDLVLVSDDFLSSFTNLKVTSDVLYCKLSINKNGKYGDLLLYHRNEDDSWVKAKFKIGS